MQQGVRFRGEAGDAYRVIRAGVSVNGSFVLKPEQA